jgi:hypothetical protein
MKLVQFVDHARRTDLYVDMNPQPDKPALEPSSRGNIVHRLQAEMHSLTSLIRTLRRVGSATSIQLLGRLRRGDYGGALISAESASRVTAHGNTVYP